jgi:hypothetical protein
MIDINNLKKLVNELEVNLEYKKLSKDNIKSLKCNNGVYLIKDNSENRIVRIGTNTKDNGLKTRLNKHLQNKECSPFRRLLGEALIQAKRNQDIELWQWHIKKSELRQLLSPEEDFKNYEVLINNHEKLVTEEIKKHSYAIIPVSDTEERNKLEKKLISTYSWIWAYDTRADFDEKRWLGEYIPETGMWLSNEAFKNPMEERDLDRLLQLIQTESVY